MLSENGTSYLKENLTLESTQTLWLLVNMAVLMIGQGSILVIKGNSCGIL